MNKDKNMSCCSHKYRCNLLFLVMLSSVLSCAQRQEIRIDGVEIPENEMSELGGLEIDSGTCGRTLQENG